MDPQDKIALLINPKISELPRVQRILDQDPELNKFYRTLFVYMTMQSLEDNCLEIYEEDFDFDDPEVLGTVEYVGKEVFKWFKIGFSDRVVDFHEKMNKFQKEKLFDLGINLKFYRNSGDYYDILYDIIGDGILMDYVIDSGDLYYDLFNPRFYKLDWSMWDIEKDLLDKASKEAKSYGLKMYHEERDDALIVELDDPKISNVTSLEDLCLEHALLQDVPEDIRRLNFFQEALKRLKDKKNYLKTYLDEMIGFYS